MTSTAAHANAHRTSHCNGQAICKLLARSDDGNLSDLLNGVCIYTLRTGCTQTMAAAVVTFFAAHATAHRISHGHEQAICKVLARSNDGCLSDTLNGVYMYMLRASCVIYKYIYKAMHTSSRPSQYVNDAALRHISMSADG